MTSPNPRARHEIPLWVTVEWEAFRAEMRRRRLDQGLRQEDVAHAMGRSDDFVAILENNPRSLPNMSTVVQWVAALGGTFRAEFPPIEKE